MDAGHVTGVLVGEAVEAPVDEVCVVVVVPAVPVVAPELVVEIEDDVDEVIINFAPQMPPLDTGAPRVDLR